MCEVVYIEENTDKNVKTVKVVDPNSENSDHMTFQCNVSDIEAAAKVAEELH